MKLYMRSVMQLLVVLLFAVTLSGTAAAQGSVVHLIEVDAPIHPVSRDVIVNAIERAEEEGAAALVIQLDTPGGLMESTRDITKAILNSRVPVIVYVAPDGARAGSAGVFITMASHVAAMAPGTNIGAATPVTMGGGGAPSDTSQASDPNAEAMRRKMTNDAVAQIRSMAELRGRNVEWAEKAVTEAASVTANRAEELKVVDLLAEDMRDLLESVDGWTVETEAGEVQLDTHGAEVKKFELSWREKFLYTLANPNLAYLLMMLGFYGLAFELYNPGAIIPGVVGVIALILAFFAMQTLPLNWAGLLLLVVGIIMFLLETQVASFGMLTFGGAVSLALGSIMLFDTAIPALRVSWSVIIPTVAVSVAFFVFAITFGLKAQKNKVSSGSEGMVGETGVAITEIAPRGKVRIGSEYWNAVAESETIEAGAEVIVTREARLTLTVRRLQA